MEFNKKLICILLIYIYPNTVFKFHKAINGRFGEITILMKDYHKKLIFCTKAKNKDKWVGVVSYIDIICMTDFLANFHDDTG